jgi:hypothetical protein
MRRVSIKVLDTLGDFLQMNEVKERLEDPLVTLDIVMYSSQMDDAWKKSIKKSVKNEFSSKKCLVTLFSTFLWNRFRRIILDFLSHITERVGIRHIKIYVLQTEALVSKNVFSLEEPHSVCDIKFAFYY